MIGIDGSGRWRRYSPNLFSFFSLLIISLFSFIFLLPFSFFLIFSFFEIYQYFKRIYMKLGYEGFFLREYAEM